MYVVNQTNNTIQPLGKKTFSESGFSERKHLQEWIVSHPEVFGEKLLIIQKEFSGFPDTYERLDLLALDKDGNLVIIENKLDDSGRDVTWQALKYASYCSTLKKEDIRDIFQKYLEGQAQGKNATEVLEDFFGDREYSELVLNQRMSQRIILVAANFRMEVTSTVLWLMNFKIHLQCFKATPYELNGQYFLAIDQIIPIKDAQDYIISMNNKAQEEFSTDESNKTRHKIRLKFWGEFLKAIKGKSTLFQSSSATKENSLIAGGLGVTYITYQVVISNGNSYVKVNFGRSSQEENKLLFDALYRHKDEIDAAFGEHLSWERTEEIIRSSIVFYKQGQNYYNEDEWPAIIDFLITHINKLEKAVKPFTGELKTALLSAGSDTQELLGED
ncbi:DUF4268 domain-containing protein [Chitinophaga sp. GCM10012297]|uniref:DUF4268 domain-containing protein n=1 Tax=Chitinophaga chungangae TaxID=2821488 RepID=A0ABS3YEP9_9BACT|nr:DUF4268 domain-containing protein [Chitinophaga chungangae]MBO9153155.1 DUF4268 domain-containing protein [Chitinophaga chungangae]